VGLAYRTCVNSRADPAEVRRDAEARGWTAIDPASAPGESPQYILDGKVYTRTHAWQLQLRGKTYWVSQFDVPGQAAVRECSVMARDLDFEAVDAVFLGRRRDEDDRARALPVRRFNDPKGTVMYTWSDDGEHSLHVVSVTPSS
jgi:hypothetical protein